MGLVHSATRIVTKQQEDASVNREQLLTFEFMTAYTALRQAVPYGDLRIRVYVEQPSGEDWPDVKYEERPVPA